MKKQSFIKGSVILIASAIVSKAIGALFKIPLTNMLGGIGISSFSCAYGLFLPVYSVTANGLTTAVAKLTAESCAVGNYKNIKKIRNVSLAIFSAIGLLGMIAVAVMSEFFSDKVAACPDAFLSVLVIAPSVLFGCISAVYRGCCEGMSNMYPTAISQVIESVIRLTAGLGLCAYVLANSQKVLTYFPKGTDITAVASAAAILGISLSTLAGLIVMYIWNTDFEKYSDSQFSTDSRKTICKKIFKIFIPVALGAVITNLTSVIDLTTIIRCLDKAVKTSPDYFSRNYPVSKPEDISEFFYGSYTGLAITVFNLIPSVTNMFGKGILPSLSESFAKNDKIAVKRLSENVIKATAFIGVPSGLGIFVLAKPILYFLFSDRPSEAFVSSQSLAILGIAVIFLSLSVPLFSCFQSAGRADIPAKLMLVGVAVKLSGNLILIPIPQINISGAAISTLLCYFVIFFLCIIIYPKVSDVKPNLFKSLAPSVFSGTACALSAWLAYTNLPFENNISLPLSIATGGIVYLIFSVLCGNIITKRKLNIKN